MPPRQARLCKAVLFRWFGNGSLQNRLGAASRPSDDDGSDEDVWLFECSASKTDWRLCFNLLQQRLNGRKVRLQALCLRLWDENLWEDVKVGILWGGCLRLAEGGEVPRCCGHFYTACWEPLLEPAAKKFKNIYTVWSRGQKENGVVWEQMYPQGLN